jgi:glycerol-3-phosphate dehydrogenase
MEHTHSDLFIIGGGINGAGIAADAAGRGLSVTLCEKNDLASATSSWSSKLVHGGLRYLGTYDFSLVHKALQEREILLRKAPHIIWPLEFVLPHSKHIRPAWMIRLGLFIYDHLASHPLLPNSKKIDLTTDPRGAALQASYKTGFSYYDCYDDDARLVVLNALDAKEHGAVILPQHECLSANFANDLWLVQLKNQLDGTISNHTAKVLINAAGPWVSHLQKKLVNEKNPLSVALIKGSHLVVPKLYDGDFAYILQNPDERVVFTIPFYDEFTLIGTTDVPYQGDLDNVKISEAEANYLCETVNTFFKSSITPFNAVWSYSGVRCLQNDNAKKASEITRDYSFKLDNTTALLTIISGKITTYRVLAEAAVNALKVFFPNLKPAWTRDHYLPGGDLPDGDFKKFVAAVSAQYPWLPASILRRYARSYGTRLHVMLENTHSLTELGKDFGAGLYAREINYLQQQEWATTAEDILWRRTKLGLFLTQAEKDTLNDYLTAQ